MNTKIPFSNSLEAIVRTYDQKLENTPRRNKHLFDVCHIQQMYLDVYVTASADGVGLDRPVVTMAVDNYSRKVAAWNVGPSHESARSVLLTLHDFNRRYSRLPTTVVVDDSIGFYSEDFLSFCQLHKIVIQHSIRNSWR